MLRGINYMNLLESATAHYKLLVILEKMNILMSKNYIILNEYTLWGINE